MRENRLNPRLRLIQNMDIENRVILLRVDHNVVKKGIIKDPYRIDVSLKTLYHIASRCGRPILMTHVGRPRDKKTGKIQCRDENSVAPVVDYLRRKLPIRIEIPELPIDSDWGIKELVSSIYESIGKLRTGEIHMLYLPNIRWFQGEEARDEERDRFLRWLSSLGEVFVNDAISAWRPHVSTYDIAKRLPSCAGFQMQEEIVNIQKVLEPQRPFLAIVAGSKYDTKIGPLKELYMRADHILLGGVIYNVFLSVRNGVHIDGVSDEDRGLAKELVELDKKYGKIIDIPYLVESRSLEERRDVKTISIRDMKDGNSFSYILDMSPLSLESERIRDAIESAKTIFVNAVMGLTPLFSEGTKGLYRKVAENHGAQKLFAGGDTLQELRNLCPDIYLHGMESDQYYYFTGGGSVLTAIEKGDPYELEPVKALMEDSYGT